MDLAESSERVEDVEGRGEERVEENPVRGGIRESWASVRLKEAEDMTT